jgi:hypothetical protein
MGFLVGDEIHAFASMTKVVEDVARAIRDNKSSDMHPNFYNAIMDAIGFTWEAMGWLHHRQQVSNLLACHISL